MSPQQWPSSRDFQEAIQNPSLAFTDAELRALSPALDRHGMPIVTSGQFAYVFKLNEATGSRAQAVRCFRGFSGDREKRYQAIDNHLDTTSIPCIASFDYDPAGISVLGRKFPTLVMEWIDGLPLDVYIGDVFHQPEVLNYLADEWLKVVASLREAGVAHGDLQHGNIIVQNDDLRLVDLDGMFVPQMAGWRASELGHKHYQHPQRAEQHFAIGLDNFSALVIYISFLALAEAPELWPEFHDENLIFANADFSEPSSSRLFGKLRKVGPVQQFVATLETACRRDPLQCPYLLDLVAPPSKLPSWLRKGSVSQTKTLTREAQAKSGAPPTVQSQFRREVVGPSSPGGPWWQQPAGPATAAPGPVPGATTNISSPQPFGIQPVTVPKFLSRPVFEQTLNYATARLVWIWLWFPTVYLIFHNAGAPAQPAGFMTLLAYLLVCHFSGYRHVVRCMSPLSSALPTTPTGKTQIPVTNVRPHQPSYRQPAPAPSLWNSSSSTSASAATVGNRVSRVFHVPSCGWANRIRARNRVSFGSPTQASARGFRPCGVCRPS